MPFQGGVLFGWFPGIAPLPKGPSDLPRRIFGVGPPTPCLQEGDRALVRACVHPAFIAGQKGLKVPFRFEIRRWPEDTDEPRFTPLQGRRGTIQEPRAEDGQRAEKGENSLDALFRQTGIREDNGRQILHHECSTMRLVIETVLQPKYCNSLRMSNPNREGSASEKSFSYS